MACSAIDGVSAIICTNPITTHEKNTKRSVASTVIPVKGTTGRSYDFRLDNDGAVILKLWCALLDYATAYADGLLDYATAYADDLLDYATAYADDLLDYATAYADGLLDYATAYADGLLDYATAYADGRQRLCLRGLIRENATLPIIGFYAGDREPF